MRKKIAFTVAAATMMAVASPAAAQTNTTVSNQGSTQFVGQGNVPGFVGQFTNQRQNVDQSNGPSGGGGTATNLNDQGAGSSVGDIRGSGSGVSVNVIQNTDQNHDSFQRGGSGAGSGPAAQRNDAFLNQGSSQSASAGSEQIQDTNQDQLINQRNAAKAPAVQDNNAVAAQGSSQFQSGGVFQLQNTRQNQFARQLNVISGNGGSESAQNNFFFSPAQFSAQGQFSPFAVFQQQTLFQNSDSDQDNRFVPAR